MQPNNNIPGNTSNVAAPTNANMPGNMPNMTTPVSEPAKKPSDVVFRDKQRRGAGMTIGIIVLILLASSGVGFGVWAYLSGNQKESGLNERIKELETEVATKESKISELESSLSTLEEKAINQQQIDSDGTTAETGTFVKEIGECVGDSGTGPNGGGTVIIKCDVLTSNGEGKFVYDSDSNQLRIVMNQE
ncbi:hypothetical protein IKF92_03085 [Candidatus Saccharibacteria bacterium]|nr:hypothetical protein [Candidatus Saccharibacteria bacterium]